MDNQFAKCRYAAALLAGLLTATVGLAQERSITFGTQGSYHALLSDKGNETEDIRWINVNTEPSTWRRKGDLLICSGQPIGVMRSERQYENYVLTVEWRHMEAGGNSGMFMWSDAKPGQQNRLPGGVEVQMLELDWVNQNKRNGETPPIAYVHGELFGVGGVITVPDNPRGERSKSVENRCKGKGEWNYYEVVCVDGTIKLSVNGKFVNGISQSTIKKGYICLESEGAEIHFRNLRIVELSPGVTSAEQTVESVD
ncbi:3-keto-disaccharide hydrolase [Parapedobacter sp. DT-150]|uniref:3-keto-disaccharide hydrolase n=1 Tax=Parapedobacter sp. DT-150 TaxID=3396162 RepID=UPI003F19C7DB